MRLREFNEKVRKIEGEVFNESSLDPITYGWKRSRFEEQKFQRLIALAGQMDDLKLIQMRTARWKRQLDRTRRKSDNFQRLLEEARASKPINGRVGMAPLEYVTA